MGLDGVELVLALEEEFDIEITDDEAPSIFTVGQLYELIKKKVEGAHPGICLSHHMFNKIRRALIDNYRLKRCQIKPSVKLLDLVPEKDLKEGWPYLPAFSGLKIPEYKLKLFFTGRSRDTTIGDLVRLLVAVNGDDYKVLYKSDDDIWIRTVKVFGRQLNIPPEEIRLNSRIADDLGVD
ncbi:MAG: acyl carrier protein [Candidatus Melainabacteria bacterium]|nr:acyl carrier protein [Candidatus Melainabacteria bacterium]